MEQVPQKEQLLNKCDRKEEACGKNRRIPVEELQMSVIEMFRTNHGPLPVDTVNENLSSRYDQNYRKQTRKIANLCVHVAFCVSESDTTTMPQMLRTTQPGTHLQAPAQ